MNSSFIYERTSTPIGGFILERTDLYTESAKPLFIGNNHNLMAITRHLYAGQSATLDVYVNNTFGPSYSLEDSRSTAWQDDMANSNREKPYLQDLRLNNEIVIFNLTDENIFVTFPGERVRMYPPVRAKLLSNYVGKIVIFETLSYESEFHMEVYGGIPDYFNQVRESIIKDKDIFNSKVTKEIENLEVAKYLSDKAPTIKDQVPFINVCRMLEIDNLTGVDHLKTNDIYVKEYECMISLKPRMYSNHNPLSLKKDIDIGDLDGQINNNKLSFFINDPKNKLSKRFVFIGGQILEVPVIQDPILEEGFRSSSIVNGSVIDTKFVPIDDIEDCTFLFTSMEDAKKCHDFLEHVSKLDNYDKFDIAKVKKEHEKEMMEMKRENERELLEMKRQAERDKIEAAERERVQKAEIDRLERKNKKKKEKREEEFKERERIQNEREKQREREWQEKTNEEKYRNEKNKTNNDFYSNVIKLAISVVTALGVLYTVFAKRA